MSGEMTVTFDIRISLPVTGEETPDIIPDELRIGADAFMGDIRRSFGDDGVNVIMRPLRGAFYRGDECVTSFRNPYDIGGNGRV